MESNRDPNHSLLRRNHECHPQRAVHICFQFNWMTSESVKIKVSTRRAGSPERSGRRGPRARACLELIGNRKAIARVVASGGGVVEGGRGSANIYAHLAATRSPSWKSACRGHAARTMAGRGGSGWPCRPRLALPGCRVLSRAVGLD